MLRRTAGLRSRKRRRLWQSCDQNSAQTESGHLDVATIPGGAPAAAGPPTARRGSTDASEPRRCIPRTYLSARLGVNLRSTIRTSTILVYELEYNE